MTNGITSLTMPRWGLSMTEGRVGDWHIELGDEVKKGQEVLDIETEKIANAHEAPVDGVLRRRIVGTGDVAPVGALLGIISDPSISESEIDAFAEAFVAPKGIGSDEAESADLPRAKQIVIAGQPLQYLETGDPQKPAVVLLHGFGGDLNSWLFTRSTLEEFLHVYSLDFPGHGGSAKALATGKVDDLVNAVLGFIEAVGLQRTHLIGHSLGGAVAALVAARSPLHTISLTLIAPMGLGEEVDGDYVVDFIKARRRKEMQKTLQKLFFDPALANGDIVEGSLRYTRLDGVEQALAALHQDAFSGNKQKVALPKEIVGAAIPTQVIWGREDRIIPSHHLASLSSPITKHILDGAGHMVHLERSKEVNLLIREFIEATDNVA